MLLLITLDLLLADASSALAGQFLITAALLECPLVLFPRQVATLGYVGLGFSPTGGMAGADIVLAWVDEKQQVQLSVSD